MRATFQLIVLVYVASTCAFQYMRDDLFRTPCARLGDGDALPCENMCEFQRMFSRSFLVILKEKLNQLVLRVCTASSTGHLHKDRQGTASPVCRLEKGFVSA